MAMNSMVWALLLLAAPGDGPSDVFHIKDADFQIPITIRRPERRAEIKKFILFVSRDQGKSWADEATAMPEDREFKFHADRDGIYWFQIAIINSKDNSMEPRSVYGMTPGQKIVVDTKKPQVRLTANRVGEDIQASWEIEEEYPKTSSLKLEYQTAEMPEDKWSPVAITAAGRGDATFNPRSRSTVTVRVSVEDLAGNYGEMKQQVFGMLPMTSLGGNGSGSNPVQPVSGQGAGGSLAPNQGGGVVVPPPEPGPRPVPGGAYVEPERPTIPPATVTNPTGGGQPYAPNGGSTTVSSALPEIQIIRKRQVTLDFEVDKYGPSGLGSVDVWVTLDNGKTWTLSPSDNNAGFPMPADMRPGQPVRGSVTVQLNKPDPTVYGFTLVVKSRAGRGKPPPRSGDAPQVRVEVDMTLPEAKLYEPKADPLRRDSLVLSWHAADRNLAQNPVTLEWAETKAGPWNVIGTPQMPNTGSYTWRVPSNIPFQVYLRLSVRDLADNVGIDVTTEPVVVDLSEPDSPTVRVNIGK